MICCLLNWRRVHQAMVDLDVRSLLNLPFAATTYFASRFDLLGKRHSHRERLDRLEGTHIVYELVASIAVLL